MKTEKKILILVYFFTIHGAMQRSFLHCTYSDGNPNLDSGIMLIMILTCHLANIYM